MVSGASRPRMTVERASTAQARNMKMNSFPSTTGIEVSVASTASAASMAEMTNMMAEGLPTRILRSPLKRGQPLRFR
jgi:hypothetical protein